ncbi:MAG: hypothetical protein AB9835_02720 [Eubacteriales bacterium]
MEYKFSPDGDFSDLSAGRVLIHRSGFTNFPVRLAQEIFLRCLSYCDKKEGITLYDPCCGGAYLLTVLGYLNPAVISNIFASDTDEDALSLASDNLSLLTPPGLERRSGHLRELYAQDGRQSHAQALESVERWTDRLSGSPPPHIEVYARDISAAPDREIKADILISDLPYGSLTKWEGEGGARLPDILASSVRQGGIVALCSDKGQRFKSEQFERVEKQSIGKRKFEIYKII